MRTQWFTKVRERKVRERKVREIQFKEIKEDLIYERFSDDNDSTFRQDVPGRRSKDQKDRSNSTFFHN